MNATPAPTKYPDDVLMPDGIVAIDDLLCHCGDPGDSFRRIREELERCEKDHAVRTEEDWKYDHIVACLCDYAKMTEHGSSLTGAWLTEEGKKSLAFLRQWGNDWFDKAMMVDREGVVHGFPK